MKFFLIAGEASGDLHASRLMRSLAAECAARGEEAEFRYYGGDKMRAEGGELLCHYSSLAYMGFVPVLLHLRTILRGLAECKHQIAEWRPHAVILVDYPGFNLKIARFVHAQGICPVCYYISPKIWAWKERRIRAIRRDVTRLFAILPFESEYFLKKHRYAVTYVGNPTADEIFAWQKNHGTPRHDGRTIALLPGSRRQEIKDNLSRILRAASPLAADGRYRLAVAAAPSIPRSFYESIIRRVGVDPAWVELVEGRTYETLSRSVAALVTSGTATLETALFGVPQVVCYYTTLGSLVSLLRRLFLRVPYISLVNLVCSRCVVPELVAGEMSVDNARRHLLSILPGGVAREAQLAGYGEMRRILGGAGAPARAAQGIMEVVEGNA
jgi:lipid-A-disaccharide synthase